MTVLLTEWDEAPEGWADFDEKKLLDEVVSGALRAEGFEENVQVSVTFTDEEGIREANRSFRGMDAPTDVLSFPMLEFEKEDGSDTEWIPAKDSMDFDPDTGELLLGDIVLCIPRVLAQAREYGHSVKREYAFLLVHSMLHLMGWAHMTPDEREAMEARQREILSEMGITREV